MDDKGTRYDRPSQDEAMVSPRRLRWLPVNLGSAADLGGLLTLVTQNWVGAAIFGALGLVLGAAQIARYRGHLVGRAVLVAVGAVAIGGVTFGFAADRLIVAARDNNQTVSTPEAATTKSLLEVPSIGGAYERSPQTVSGRYAERVLSRKLSCRSASSKEFQLNGKFRGFRAHVGLEDYHSDSDS